MPTLIQYLNKLPAHDLRAMASRLQVSNRKNQRKQAWIEAIVHLWSAPAGDEDRLAALARLSAQAHHALCRLAGFQQLPANLFWAEYGMVRRPRQGDYAPKPWREPRSAAEELYYAGLLHGVDHPALERASALTVPIDLRPMVNLLACRERDVTPTDAGNRSGLPSAMVAWTLAHDVGQMLIFLMQQERTDQGIRLLHETWLDQRALRRLNQRLATPDARPIRSHKQTTRLRSLIFLTAAAGLQENGHVTVAGRAWLQEPLPEQISWLWQGWRDADGQLRSRYDLADSLLPPPWPEPLLQALATAIHERGAITSAAGLMDALLDGSPQEQAYWSRQVANFSDFQRLLQGVLDETLTPLGVVESVHPDHAQPLYAITPVGGWLLGEGETTMVDADWRAACTAATPVARLVADIWRLDLPANAPLDLQATVAGFGVYTECRRQDSDIWHCFELDALSVGKAATEGLGEAALIEALARLGIPLDAEQRAQLMRWRAATDDVRISVRFLLETRTPELLARLASAPHLRKHIHEVLNPTVAVVNAEPAVLVSELQTLGIRPRVSWTKQERSDPDMAGEAALWLAARLYIELARHFPLPLPLPRRILDGLAASLTERERALLDTRLEQLHDGLDALLDGETFAPPPEASEPETWRKLIEDAAAGKQVLDLVYFSAGRNMLTRRQVTPFWIEERESGSYMRGYCHTRGDVRLFRLDRIQSLADG